MTIHMEFLCIMLYHQTFQGVLMSESNNMQCPDKSYFPPVFIFFLSFSFCSSCLYSYFMCNITDTLHRQHKHSLNTIHKNFNICIHGRDTRHNYFLADRQKSQLSWMSLLQLQQEIYWHTKIPGQERLPLPDKLLPYTDMLKHQLKFKCIVLKVHHLHKQT